jgi:hypothetical protein
MLDWLVSTHPIVLPLCCHRWQGRGFSKTDSLAAKKQFVLTVKRVSLKTKLGHKRLFMGKRCN